MKYIVRTKHNVQGEYVEKVGALGTVLDVASNRKLIIVELDEGKLEEVKGLDFVDGVDEHPNQDIGKKDEPLEDKPVGQEQKVPEVTPDDESL